MGSCEGKKKVSRTLIYSLIRASYVDYSKCLYHPDRSSVVFMVWRYDGNIQYIIVIAIEIRESQTFPLVLISVKLTTIILHSLTYLVRTSQPCHPFRTLLSHLGCYFPFPEPSQPAHRRARRPSQAPHTRGHRGPPPRSRQGALLALQRREPPLRGPRPQRDRGGPVRCETQ